MFPRHRLDALTDGIFGVAMTLLVLELRIPDSVDPHTDRELMAVLVSLMPKIWPYALSFAVLGGRWRAMIGGRTSHAPVSRRHVIWTLINLFLVSLMPFSTQVISRFASLSPGIWVYTANLVGLSLSAWKAARNLPDAEREAMDENTTGLVMLLLASAVVVTLSLFHSAWATLGFLVSGLTPLVRQFTNRSKPEAKTDA